MHKFKHLHQARHKWEWSCTCVFKGHQFCLCRFDISIRLWSCSEYVVFFVFNFILLMEAIEAVNIYKWTLTDGIHSNGLYTKWQEVDVIHIINQTHVSGENLVHYSCVNLYNRPLIHVHVLILVKVLD
jgi:hypothetical protein